LQDAVAALVDLGERGVLTLRDERLRNTTTDVRVTLHGSADDPALRSYERVLLSALFGFNATSGEVLLSAARSSFAAAVPILAERLHAEVAAAGLFVANPARVRRQYTAIGAALAAGGVVLAFVTLAALAADVPLVVLPGLAVTIIGVALLAMARAMPRRTPRGALEAARWRAFRDFLVDEQRHSKDDQRYLSYAVAFGIDRSFLRQLEQTGRPQPNWYGGGPVIVMPGGTYGGPWVGGGGGLSPRGSSGSPTIDGPDMPSPQGWSDALAGLLNAASEAMAQGGGSGGWSGGSWGGGGGGGGGSGGFN
jgi:hypothetical protein